MPDQTTALYLFSDRHRCPDWRTALSRAGPHCRLILRDYDAPDRRALAAQMAAFCRAEKRGFAIAGDRDLARQFAAAFHCPSYLLTRLVRHPTAAHADYALDNSAAIHNLAELYDAARAGFAQVFISPVFMTDTHPGRRGLGVVRAQNLARAARACGLSPLALGGMTARRLRRLNGAVTEAEALFAGYGAISAFAD